ncbi:hypothetical protein BACCAP_03705 [Pseudoflavonifractor capillosus ATCC 29799]|uniref:Uncharacterized protein n=1 Tax=Pseudoflavonifractor capillosus ATCC 29799 TaxID=411467 RepID=A6NZQ1_9FIRM|nr:hypothetical protein BACCAP_03705 [Pseudoflavonifractor capillosus ATCC 29799]
MGVSEDHSDEDFDKAFGMFSVKADFSEKYERSTSIL